MALSLLATITELTAGNGVGSASGAHTVTAGTDGLVVIVQSTVLDSADQTWTATWQKSGGSLETLTQYFENYNAATTSNDPYFLIFYITNPTAGAGTFTLTCSGATAIRGGQIYLMNFSGFLAASLNVLASQRQAGSATTSVSLSGTPLAGSFLFGGLTTRPTGSTPTQSSVSYTPGTWNDLFTGSGGSGVLSHFTSRTLAGASATAYTISATYNLSTVDIGGLLLEIKSGSNAYSVDSADTGTATDATDASFATGGDIAESATATDATDASFTADDGVVESATATDAADAGFTVTDSVVEAATVGDSGDAFLAAADAVAETATASDVTDASAVLGDGVFESAAASDTTDTTSGIPVSVAESVAAGDASDGYIALPGDIAESATATDATDYAFSIGGLTTDTATATDTVDAFFQVNADVAESAAASDTTDTSLAGDNAVSETATATDTADAAVNFAVAVAESATAADAADTTSVMDAAVAEAATATDTADSTAVPLGGVGETATATDSTDASLVGDNAISEGVAASDTADASNAVAGDYAEAVAAQDGTDAFNTVLVAVAETATATDATDYNLALGAAVAETVTATDSSDAAIVIAVDVEEFVVAADSSVASKRADADNIETVSAIDTVDAQRTATPVAGGIKGRQQLPNPGQYIELWTIDMSPLGGRVYYFVYQNVSIFFNGVEYKAMPVEGEGFETSADSGPARPKLRVSNAVKALIGEMVRSNNFRGAIVTRMRTLYRYCDGQPDVDPEAHWPLEKYRIDRLAKREKPEIEWELASDLAFLPKRVPARKILRDYCAHTYRKWNGTTFVQGSCPYRKTNYFQFDNTPTSDPALDVCSKRLTGCELRFPNEPLPMRAFPDVARRG